MKYRGYVYAAEHHAAQLARALGDDPMAAELNHSAERLRHDFDAAFWCDELATCAIALDGAKRLAE